jgi:small subunit ribosomal protein S6
VRDYELIIVIQPELADEPRKELIETVANQLTFGEGEDAKPKINEWGTRQLAYEINDNRTGYYVFYQCTLEPSAVAGIERNLYYMDDVLRYLVVRADEQAALAYDYKQPNELRRYISDHGQITPRRRNRVSASQQRQIAKAVKRARHIALLPFVAD